MGLFTDSPPDVQAPAPDAPGKDTGEDRGTEALARLRAKHKALPPDAPRAKRGRPPKARGPEPASDPSPGPAPVIDAQRLEMLHRKIGTAWRGVGMAMAAGTNCNVWFLSPEEEKILGESYGDLLFELGFTHALAVQIITCVGVTLGVFGLKAIGYSAFIRQQKAAVEALKKRPETAPGPGEAVTDAGSSVIHSTPPGVL